MGCHFRAKLCFLKMSFTNYWFIIWSHKTRLETKFLAFLLVVKNYCFVFLSGSAIFSNVIPILFGKSSFSVFGLYDLGATDLTQGSAGPSQISHHATTMIHSKNSHQTVNCRT